MMAKTRFMPPPQIGVAQQTYWTAVHLKLSAAKFRQDFYESIHDQHSTKT